MRTRPATPEEMTRWVKHRVVEMTAARQKLTPAIRRGMHDPAAQAKALREDEILVGQIRVIQRMLDYCLRGELE